MKKKGLFITNSFDLIYNQQQYKEICELVDIYLEPLKVQEVQANPEVLKDCQIIFSGWGCPTIDQEFLDAAPNLEFVFYGAGSLNTLVTDAFWQANIGVCSAWGANAVPVAEYTLAHILIALKRGLFFSRKYKEAKKSINVTPETGAGAYNSTVGIISLGMIGQLACKLLKPFQVDIIAYDPFTTEDQAQELGVTLVSLEDLFVKADVVSLHTPWLPETEGMINGALFDSMKHGATFINTARGAVVNEPEMIEVLQRRNDLQAVLDVTYPEPPTPDSPIWEMENIYLTPHIGGSMGSECNRHAEYMLDDLKNYLAGTPLKWQVDQAKFKIMA